MQLTDALALPTKSLLACIFDHFLAVIMATDPFNSLQRELTRHPHTPDQIARCREKFGFCVDCRGGRPTQLYNISDEISGPCQKVIREHTKEAIDVAGVCTAGVCFVCYPEKDPTGIALYE